MNDATDARHALAILRCFEEGPTELQADQIACQVELERRAVAQALATLCDEEFLDRGHDGSYRIGKVLAILGRRMEEASGLDRAQVLLEELTRRTAESTSLSVRSGAHAVVMLLAPSPQRLRVEHGVGSRLPLHASAMGKALNREEQYDGVVGVAAPVIVAGRGVVAAIGVQGPAARLRTPEEPSLTRLVQRTALGVAKCLASGVPLSFRDTSTFDS
jgi:IclR family KDG regulon transcriptional repressor